MIEPTEHHLPNLNATELKERLKLNRPLLVECFSKHCAPCARMAPLLKALSVKYSDSLDVFLADLSDPSNDDLREAFSIRAVPTFLLFAQGALMDQRSGSCSKLELEQFLLQAMKG